MKRVTILIGILCALILTMWCGLFVSASAEGGTYHGMDWDLTDGVLTLGREGETQTMVDSSMAQNKWPWKNKSSIVEVRCQGPIAMSGSLCFMFYNCTNLTSVDLSACDTSAVTNMEDMFLRCNSLVSLNLSGWNTSNVTDMSGMFEKCSSLVSLDLSGFDMSNVTDIYAMFEDCSSLTALEVSNWRTDNVTSMGRLFLHCSQLSSLDVSGWNTSNVTGMSAMFTGCSKLTSLDLSQWNTSKVTKMGQTNYAYGMFEDCTSLTFLDVSGFDTSHVTNMYDMFEGCRSLTFLDLSSFDTRAVEDMNRIFAGCAKLKEVVLGENFSFVGDGSSTYGTLPTPPESQDDVQYTRKWIRQDGEFGPFTPDELRDNYVSNMAGTWIWEIVQTEYTISFVFSDPEVTGYMDDVTAVSAEAFVLPECRFVVANGAFDHWEDDNGRPYADKAVIPANTYAVGTQVTLTAIFDMARDYTLVFQSSEPNAVGNMPNIIAPIDEAVQIPVNGFYLLGYRFDHWDDGNGHIYEDQAIIPANTYEGNATVTLFAVFAPRDKSVHMRNGEFTFSIYGDEKAFFDGIPAGTSYSVFEENIPEDWVLIAQSNSTGVIYPLEEAEALFLNKYQPDMATIQFTGRKLMDGQPAKADSFFFFLWEGNVLLQTKSVIDGGFVQFDILEYGRNDAGIHTYVIKELVGVDDAILYDGHEETIDVEVTTEVGDDNITRVRAEVMHSEGTYPDILFENWTKPGELSLKKLVDDLLEGHEGDEFRFRITFKQENGLPLNDTLTCIIEP